MALADSNRAAGGSAGSAPADLVVGGAAAEALAQVSALAASGDPKALQPTALAAHLRQRREAAARPAVETRGARRGVCGEREGRREMGADGAGRDGKRGGCIIDDINQAPFRHQSVSIHA